MKSAEAPRHLMAYRLPRPLLSTLFATHYHEVTDLSNTKSLGPKAKNTVQDSLPKANPPQMDWFGDF
jgi:hypothetical protein